ncbi:hypothetical protein NW767_012462 [Fusarium falciforme]|uniref:Uncharacterized protein n=1 Tax=Fusarium falciforme TaxID=195108 RepID=A0A9W8V1V4_9HYPO|nr:hypothetical protein NW767_012462 [Fusarium falciforme]KAJ4189350.1 hypothetical protein NW755_006169 [Fusarium falciforme]KAJ4241576.1 hypothetical protein NW757_012151 [Fusarium falciforme]
MPQCDDHFTFWWVVSRRTLIHARIMAVQEQEFRGGNTRRRQRQQHQETAFNGLVRNQHPELYFVISQCPIIMRTRFIRRPDRRGRTSNYRPVASHVLCVAGAWDPTRVW